MLELSGGGETGKRECWVQDLKSYLYFFIILPVSELRNYHEHLKKILINVENILIHKWPAVQMSDFTKSKRFF